jgi:hypothetical protein
MDINNVESQLQYVGIALRDTNGELRSTEDVLDELGKKWDTLDKNQQAAIAKALAGTRQQSRLIAMMEDYERVTELQEISQRSAGATAAQAGTYLEGIEAALNKIQVSWEKIVMTISDSEVIIGFLEFVSSTLDGIGDFLSTDFGMVVLMSTIASIGLSILGNKIRESEINRKNYLLELKKQRVLLDEQKEEKKSLRLEKESYLAGLKTLKNERKITKEEMKQAIAKAESDGDTVKAARLKAELAGMEFRDTKEQAEIDAEIKATKHEIFALKQDELLIDSQITKNTFEQFQNSSGFVSALSSVIPILTVIVGLASLWNTLQTIGIGLTKLGTLAIKKRTKANTADAAASTVGMVAEGGKAGAQSGGLPGFIAGLAIALGVAAALAAVIGGIALGSIAIKGVKEEKRSKTAEGAAESINKLSNEIYKLNEKANNLNSIGDSFDKIDRKLIKTNEDLKEMNSLLDQAADALSDEIEDGEDIGYGAGVSEKEYYESFSTEKGKRQALADIEKNTRKKANQKRTDQINAIKKLSGNELKKFLDENTTNAEIRMAQDAIYALNNNELYEYIDAQKDSNKITESQAAAIESLTQSILDEMSTEEA